MRPGPGLGVKTWRTTVKEVSKMVQVTENIYTHDDVGFIGSELSLLDPA